MFCGDWRRTGLFLPISFEAKIAVYLEWRIALDAERIAHIGQLSVLALLFRGHLFSKADIFTC